MRGRGIIKKISCAHHPPPTNPTGAYQPPLIIAQPPAGSP